MNSAEILDKRIATAKRRYEADIKAVIDRLKWEQTRIEEGQIEKYFEVINLSEVHSLLKNNNELGALLALKDQIENQARD